MGKMIPLHEAEADLRNLVSQAEQGAEIVISDNGKPVARLVPVAAIRSPRIPGVAKGQFALTEAFFEPLPEDELAAWGQ